jgi:TRAP transporter TatT component family protein
MPIRAPSYTSMPYAENVLVTQKDKTAFQQMIQPALKIDVNTWPEHRQLNLLMQRRVQWLLSRTYKLFPAALAHDQR